MEGQRRCRRQAASRGRPAVPQERVPSAARGHGRSGAELPPLTPGTEGTEGRRSVCLGGATRVWLMITPESVCNVLTLPGTDGHRALRAGAGESFKCERCGKVFAYRYYRDKHLKYTRCVDQGDRKFPCHLCSRSFEKRDRLRIHVLHVHEKHRPHKVRCPRSFLGV